MHSPHAPPRFVNLVAENGRFVRFRRRREVARILQQKHVREGRAEEGPVHTLPLGTNRSPTLEHLGRVVNLLAARTVQFYGVHVRLVAQAHGKEVLVVAVHAGTAAEVVRLELLQLHVTGGGERDHGFQSILGDNVARVNHSVEIDRCVVQLLHIVVF